MASVLGLSDACVGEVDVTSVLGTADGDTRLLMVLHAIVEILNIRIYKTNRFIERSYYLTDRATLNLETIPVKDFINT